MMQEVVISRAERVAILSEGRRRNGRIAEISVMPHIWPSLLHYIAASSFISIVVAVLTNVIRHHRRRRPIVMALFRAARKNQR